MGASYSQWAKSRRVEESEMRLKGEDDYQRIHAECFPLGVSTMEQARCADLPTEILLTILRHLPADSIFKFRLVCKMWHEILTNPRFLETWSGTAHRSSFCVLADFPNQRVSIYNIESRDWYHVPLESLLTNHVSTNGTILTAFTNHFSTKGTFLTASAGGLVFFEVLSELPQGAGGDDTSSTQSLLLVNPMTKSFRRLPALALAEGNPHNGRFPAVVGTNWDLQRGSFQILGWLNHEIFGVRRNSELYVYDLEVNTWEMISTVRGPYGILKPAVLHGGFWYFLSYVQRNVNHEFIPTVSVFRVERGKQAERMRTKLPHKVGFVIDLEHLFVCQGKLILAGSMKKMDDRHVTAWLGFRFWELDEESSEWVHYLMMPQYLVNFEDGELPFPRGAMALECSADGDYICCWASCPVKDYGMSLDSRYGSPSRWIWIIMYSISRGAWWRANSVSNRPSIPIYRPNYGSRARNRCTKQPFAYFWFKPNLKITL